jgi:hypothetical protein
MVLVLLAFLPFGMLFASLAVVVKLPERRC